MPQHDRSARILPAALLAAGLGAGVLSLGVVDEQGCGGGEQPRAGNTDDVVLQPRQDADLMPAQMSIEQQDVTCMASTISVATDVAIAEMPRVFGNGPVAGNPLRWSREGRTLSVEWKTERRFEVDLGDGRVTTVALPQACLSAWEPSKEPPGDDSPGEDSPLDGTHHEPPVVEAKGLTVQTAVAALFATAVVRRLDYRVLSTSEACADQADKQCARAARVVLQDARTCFAICD